MAVSGKSKPRNTQRVALYLLPSVEQDAIVLDVYNAGRIHDRAQDLFRQAIFRGLRSMYETGDIPAIVLDHHNLDERLGRRLARNVHVAAPIIHPALVPPQAIMTAPAAPVAGYRPGELSVPTFEAPPAPSASVEEEPDMDAILGLMGGAKPMGREEG